MKCNYCGNEQTGNSGICGSCGSPMLPQNSVPPQGQQSAQSYDNGANNVPPQGGYYQQPNNIPPQGNIYMQPNNIPPNVPPQGNYYPSPNGQPYNMPPPNQGYYGANQKKANSSATALVFGILSLVCGGILWTVLAIVFGSKGIKERKEQGLSTAMPIVAIILGIVGLVFWSIFLMQFMSMISESMSISQRLPVLASIFG